MLGIPAERDPAHQRQDRRGRGRAARRRRRAHPAAGRRRRRPAPGPHLRLALRPVPRRRQLGPGHERPPRAPARGCASCRPGTVTRPTRSACALPGAHARGRARPGRGRLPHRRHQGRGRGPLRRDGHRAAGPPAATRSRATATPSRWCSAACTRSTATTSPTSARPREAAAQRLQLSPTSPRRRAPSGFGFRCGFLGLLHMEIVRERLEREFDLALIATAPSVEYRVHRTDGDDGRRRQPGRHAAGARRSTHIEEPYLSATILTPDRRTRARSWSCARAAAARCRSSSTSRPSGSS